MKMMRAACALAALLCAASPAVPAGAQQAGGEGRVKLNGAEVSVGGRVQTQFNTTTVETEPAGEWLLRRARLEATVRVNDLVSGKVQSELAGDRVSVKDAYLKLGFSRAVQLLAGKEKIPFSLLELTSSTRMLPIERGLRIRGVQGVDQNALVGGLRYAERDVGLQLMGSPPWAPLRFTYAVGVFGGPLQGAVGHLDTYQLAGRATLQPAERLRLGAGWSGRDFFRPAGGGATAALRRGNAFEVDLEYGAFAPGLHLLAEVSSGDVDPFAGTGFRGAQAWLGYRTGGVSRSLSAVEPIFRASHSEVDEGAPARLAGGTLLTPGLNLYFGGLNRFMVNYDFWLPNGEEGTQGSFKAMFQLAF